MALGEVRVSVLDRAYLFGDAAYEVIRVYDGKPWLLREHEQRLERSLTELKIDARPRDLEQRIQTLLARDGKRDAGVYVQVSRGEAPRSHIPPAGMRANELIYLLDVDLAAMAKKTKDGVSVRQAPDVRWGRCDIKSVNLLGNTLIAAEVKAQGFDDAVLVDRDGYVTEGTHSTFFAIKGGVLETPPLGPGILPGITREHLLRLAEGAGVPTRERRIPARELAAMDEMFLCGTLSELQPIVRLDGQPVGKGTPGPLTSLLLDLYLKAAGKKNR